MTTAVNEYTEVILAGALGKKFGRVRHLVCANAIQALKLIGLERPDFKQYLIEKAKEGIGYHIISDKRVRSEQELRLPAGKRLIIAQAVTGAKGSGGSILEIVAGAALVALAIWNPVGWVGAGALMSSGTAQAVGMLGASLVLSGITALISPTPAGSTSSYYFNGASNTVTQGQPVPVIYGEMLTGGLPISSAMRTQDLSSAPSVSGLIQQ